METIIYSFSPDSPFEWDVLRVFQAIRDIAKISIVTSKCQCKAKVTIGNYGFLSAEDIALYPYLNVHLIISGKDLSAFDKAFTSKSKEFDYINPLSRHTESSSAFTYRNSRLIDRISLKKIMICAKGTPHITIKETIVNTYR